MSTQKQHAITAQRKRMISVGVDVGIKGPSFPTCVLLTRSIVFGKPYKHFLNKEITTKQIDKITYLASMTQHVLFWKNLFFYLKSPKPQLRKDNYPLMFTAALVNSQNSGNNPSAKFRRLDKETVMQKHNGIWVGTKKKMKFSKTWMEWDEWHQSKGEGQADWVLSCEEYEEPD